GDPQLVGLRAQRGDVRGCGLGLQQRVVQVGGEGRTVQGVGHACNDALPVGAHVVDHPLAAELLARLRDERTDRATFRQAMDELAGMLVYEACRQLPTVEEEVRTPLGPAPSRRVASWPVVVPILRAGLGM